MKNKYKFFVYRYKFLFLYSIYGILSLLVELLIIKLLLILGLPYIPSALIGLSMGIVFAFGMNVRFNFKIPKAKIKIALFYFSTISTISFLFQLGIRSYLSQWGFNMDLSRFIVAGAFFLLTYWIHRKVSFKEYKKVGVAIYADGVENIQKIYDRISDITDFIHIDVVDSSFNINCVETKAYRTETVRAYWRKKEIDVHIMSKYPLKWLNDIILHVDKIFVHLNIEDNLELVIEKIYSAGKVPGLAITYNDKFESYEKYIGRIKNILILTIDNPGISGQTFNFSCLKIIDELNRHKKRAEFTLYVDGGVNSEIIKHLHVECVVSGSFVLHSENPINQIMYLQTSGEYGN